MGELDRYQDYQRYNRRRSTILLGAENNALVWLTAINVMVFLILLFIRISFTFTEGGASAFDAKAMPYFSMPAQLGLLSERPWTFITYMFTDDRVIRMISNMLWLWAFGRIMQELTGNSKLIPIFIYGGLLGALFFIIAHYVFPQIAPTRAQSMLLGAGPGVMAVATAATLLAPDYRFFRNIGNGIPIWVLTLIYLLVAFAGVAGLGAGYSLATLGGAAAGVLFVVFLKKGYDGSTWMLRLHHKLINLFTPSGDTTARDKEKTFYNTTNRTPYTKTANITQQRVDEILDKISQQGYHFLTEEEKTILKKAAESDL
jgi:membrane associated rhomboid family serine protease